MLSMAFRGDSGYLTSHGDGPEPVTTDYYVEASSEPAGRGWGPGAALLGIEGIVTKEQMEAIYDRLEDLDGNPLGSRPGKHASYEVRLQRLIDREPTAPNTERLAELRLKARKNHREARHYIDATFSPPKSWSVLHAALSAAGRHEEAAQLWDCWEAGVKAGLEYWMAESGVSRQQVGGRLPNGEGTGTFPEARGWVMTLWRHHTSRDGEPQLHIHVAILNRVLCPDGRWRALHGTAIKNMRTAVAAVAERTAEDALTRELGVTFRWDGICREIAGVDKDVRDLFSSRRRAVTTYAERLIAQYAERWGKEPSAYARKLISEQATLATRKRKGKAVTPETRIEQWEMKLRHTLDQTFAAVLDKALPKNRPTTGGRSFDREHAIEAAIADVSKRTYWRRSDLVFELRKYLPEHLDVSAEEALTELADEALASRHVMTVTAPDLIVVPDELRRSDGGHIFATQNPEIYATAEQFHVEGRLSALAREGGASHMPAPYAKALVDQRLMPSQGAFVSGFLASDAWVETLQGPPGSGKSFAVAALCAAWQKGMHKGTYGLALSQAAANVLAEEGVGRTANIARWLAFQKVIDTLDKEGIHSAKANKIRARYGISAGEVIIIDEASMVDTQQMEEVISRARAAGARTLLVGDAQQMTAVGQSGAFGHVLEHRPGFELTEIARFVEQWEREGSVLMRDGDEKAILEYERHGRLLSGSADLMRERITEHATADILRDVNTVVVVGSNEEAAEVASEIRERLVRLNRVEADGVELADGTLAGVGDVVQLRRTVAKPKLGAVLQDELTNRDTYLVTGRGSEGSLRVRRFLGFDDNDERRYGPERVLPAEYVAADVALSYASTVYSAQGRTTDKSYVLVSEQMDWRSVFVGMTRGKRENVAYIPVEKGQHRHEVLLAKMQRIAPDLSATQRRNLEWMSADHLANHGARLAEMKERATARSHVSIMRGVLSPEVSKAVVADPAFGPLSRLLRSAELDGIDPVELLTECANQRSFVGAESVAKVLHKRIEKHLDSQNVSRETVSEFVPRPYAEGIGRQQSPACQEFAENLAHAMDDRRRGLGEQAALAPPEYLADLGPVPIDPLQREEWIARAAEVEAYRERWNVDRADAIGPCPNRGNPERRAEWRSAFRALGSPERDEPMAERTDGELRSLVARHERQKDFEPANVDEAMSKALRAERQWRARATNERGQLDTMDRSTDAAGELLKKIERYERFAEKAKDDAGRLADAAEAREQWLEVTQTDREAHDHARAELRRRYPKEAAAERAAEAAAVKDAPEPTITDTETALSEIAKMREQLRTDQRREAERRRQEESRSTVRRDQGIDRSSR